MNDDELFGTFGFLVEIDKLKRVLRVNRLSDGSRRENSAEHSWHMAMLAVTLAGYSGFDRLDLLKAVKMVLVHDIVEIDAGDTYAFDQAAHHDKDQREEAAARRLFSLLPDTLHREYYELWREFEAGETDEARYVAAVDRLTPFLLHVANGGVVWKERGMTRSLLMTRMGEIERLCPPLFEFVERAVDESIERGWIDPS